MTYPISKLIDICSVRTGKRDANHATPDGKYPFFTCADRPIRSPTYAFEGEAIILPGNGANVGLVLFCSDKFEAYQRTYVLSDFKCEPRYVFHHLKRYWSAANRFSQFGSATNYIRMGNFEDYKIPMPPIAEQKRIAAILDTVEGLRGLRRQALRELDVIAQSIFIHMFGDPQVSSNIYSMKMNDLVTKFIDYRGKSPEKSEAGIPLITAKIVKGKEVKEPNEFIPKDSYDAWMRRGIPSPGDVIITTEAPMGEVALVPDYKAAFAQRLLVLQPNRNKVESIYLMWALTMPFVIRQLQQRSTGSTVTGIRSKEFKQISLPLPPISLQQEFARCIGAVEQLKTTHRESLTQLDALFASLQNRAFRGEL